MKRLSCLLMVVAVATILSLPAMAQDKTMDKEIGTPVSIVLSSPGSASATDIFVEGFNDTSANGFPPSGWLMINADGNTGTDTSWYISLTVGGQGSLPPQEGIAFAANYYGTANGFYIDDYLITPNTGGSAPIGSVDSITFWLTSRRSTSGVYPDSLDIRLSTTARGVNDFTTRLGYVHAPKALWTRFAYAIPITANRYIAFRYLLYDGGPSGTNSDKVCLDNVRITRYPSTAVAGTGGLPASFGLKQNYPNPFNPSTRIEFTVTSASQTVLKVYSLLGAEVATLVDEHLQPGSYATDFVADHLPSGVYLYKLTSGSYAEVRRMVLLK